MKIIFAGTPDFAVPSLEALVHSAHQIIAVYTQPDRPSGRGQALTESPIKKVALRENIPIFQPRALRRSAVQQELISLNADLMIVAAYGLLLPPIILSAPRLGCINIHASLLPRWRGASPIQQAILAGDEKTGITLMQMDEGLDTGDILSQSTYTIAPKETSGSLHDRLAHLGADVLLENLSKIAESGLTPIPQNNAAATYAPLIDKADALLNWNLPAIQLERCIRAFNPKPIAFTYFEGELLRIWESEALIGNPPSNTISPGTLIHADRHGIDIATGNGILRITQLQRAGKKIQSAADFYNAYRNKLIPEKTQFGT